jgi:hypothetical protein
LGACVARKHGSFLLHVGARPAQSNAEHLCVRCGVLKSTASCDRSSSTLLCRKNFSLQILYWRIESRWRCTLEDEHGAPLRSSYQGAAC